VKRKLFRKVLVANRGEIAIRVMRACHELNISTVAVYSDADRDAIHTRYAGEAIHIGGAAPAESYLNLDRIMKAAKDTGAEAIHPGYGFLSENQQFARACADNGIVFIGPGPEAMAAMGEKVPARQRMRDSGVPIVPGSDALDDVDSAVAAASFSSLTRFPSSVARSISVWAVRRASLRSRFTSSLARFTSSWLLLDAFKPSRIKLSRSVHALRIGSKSRRSIMKTVIRKMTSSTTRVGMLMLTGPSIEV